MKAREMAEARRMRVDEGESIKVIARKLGVCKSSVSGWVRDIKLTGEQEAVLYARGSWNANQKKGSDGMARKARQCRREYQEEGRRKAIGCDREYAIGCALYWAEGNKSRNAAGMANTDVDMLRRFVRFLRRYFGSADDDFRVSVMAHLDNGVNERDIKGYWLRELGLPDSCSRAFVLKTKYYPSANSKRNRHPYGCATVRTSSTEVVQQIYGSIQELFEIGRPEWLESRS